MTSTNSQPRFSVVLKDTAKRATLGAAPRTSTSHGVTHEGPPQWGANGMIHISFKVCTWLYIDIVKLDWNRLKYAHDMCNVCINIYI